MHIQDGSPLGWTGWISLLSKGLSRVFSNTTVQKHQFFCAHLSNSSVLSFLYSPTVTPYMTIGKTIALTRWTFVDEVMSLLFNMLFRFVITFPPRSKCLNFMATVTVHSDFGALENKNLSLFPHFPHLFAMKLWDQMS